MRAWSVSNASRYIYTSNYGNLVYDLKGEKGAQIESAKSFADLKKLIFVSQEAIEWEAETVPTYIERHMATHLRH